MYVSELDCPRGVTPHVDYDGSELDQPKLVGDKRHANTTFAALPSTRMHIRHRDGDMKALDAYNSCV